MPRFGRTAAGGPRPARLPADRPLPALSLLPYRRAGHLWHQHHKTTDAQYAARGRLDVVIRVVDRLRSSSVIPKHWFSYGALDCFVAGVSDACIVERRDGPPMDVSLRALPWRPTVVLLLPPKCLRDLSDPGAMRLLSGA